MVAKTVERAFDRIGENLCDVMQKHSLLFLLVFYKNV